MKIFWNPPGRTFTYHLIHVTLVCMGITSVNSNDSSIPSCTKYGSSPCLFVPAAPGQTPPCARPGSTYCERIDGYPTLLIKQLVRQWGYEARNLLIDETWDDFSAITWNNQASSYDPANAFTHTAQNNERTFHGYKYARPTDAFHDNHRNYGHNPYLSAKTAPMEDTARKLNVNRNNNIYITSVANDAKDRTSYSRALWLKRIVRDLSEKRTTPEASRHKASLIIDMSEDGEDSDDTGQSKLNKRDVSMNKNFLQIMNIQPNTVKGRRRRQSPGRVTLCQSTTQYITPQAALNSKGNWMFVVNEAETARQMVKTELCASSVCSNLCQLPNGYNSRCEQKFVQKRLIALQANGQNLYTDTFWFPSCCVCTISSN